MLIPFPKVEEDRFWSYIFALTFTHRLPSNRSYYLIYRSNEAAWKTGLEHIIAFKRQYVVNVVNEDHTPRGDI